MEAGLKSRMVGMWMGFWHGTEDERYRTEGVVIEVHEAGLLIEDWSGVEWIDDVEQAAKDAIAPSGQELVFVRWTDVGDYLVFSSVRSGVERLKKRLEWEEKMEARRLAGS